MCQRCTLCLFAFLVVLLAWNLSQVAGSDVLVEYYVKAFEQRRGVLEKLHNIQFNKGWEIKVHVDSASARGLEGYLGSYMCEGQDFWMNPDLKYHWPKAFALQDFSMYERLPHSSMLRNALVETIDHELGHAYADQVSRALGLGCYPPSAEVWDTMSQDDRIAVRIISEGIGSWFQRSSLIDREEEFKDETLPATPRSWGGFDRDKLYDTGLWIVTPTLNFNCEQGVRYLLEYPFAYEQLNLRDAARSYRRDARFNLKFRNPYLFSPP